MLLSTFCNVKIVVIYAVLAGDVVMSFDFTLT